MIGIEEKAVSKFFRSGYFFLKGSCFLGDGPLSLQSYFYDMGRGMFCNQTGRGSLGDNLPLVDDDEAVAQFGIDYATRQCAELIASGVEGIHFYTLNKSRATIEIARNLGLAE